MLKKSLIGFVVLLAVLLGGALIAPSFVDWNARLPEIAAQVKSATGRDLTIDGRLEVSILPAPTLTARGVKLGNAAGGVAAQMAELEAVEVRVALLPLLSGQVQVERIRLVKPKINIETYADGRTNLEFQAAPAEPAATPAPTTSMGNGNGEGGGEGEGGSGLGVRLDHFEIVDATVVYQDVAKGSVERIEGLTTTLRASSLQGPFEAEGEVRLRGVPLSFEASLGQIIKGRTIPITALIKAPGGARAQINGAAFEVETAPRFKGKAQVEGSNLAALLNAVTGGDGAPPAMSQAFGLNAEVNASAKDVTLSELALSLGTMRVAGQAEIALAQGVSFNVELKAQRIDVDALLGDVGATSSSSAGASKNAVATAQPVGGGEEAQAQADAGFSLPKDMNGMVSLTVDAVTFKGGVVNDVRLNVELADGELALSQFQLQAPGVTDVALFGFVKPKAGKPHFSGDLEVVSADPKGFTDWLGVQMPDGISSRLKRVVLKTKVSADPTQVTLSAIDLTGDRTQVKGGVTVALRARPSFGADLVVDALNLDTYTNGGGAATAGAAAAAGATAAEPAKSQMAQAVDMAGMWAATKALNDFDANLKVRVGSLTTNGRTLKDVAVDGTLYAGALDLRHVKVGDVLGASANLGGKFSGFGSVPEMSGVKTEIKIANANATANALNITGLPKNLGAVTLNAQADGSLLTPKLNATVAALGGNFGANGKLSLLPIGFGWDGQVTAKHGDAVKLMAALGYVPAGPLGALDVKANLKSDGATHTLSALQGSIGETALAGQVVTKTGGAKPNVVADLQTGALDIQRFLARSDNRADATPPVRNPLLVFASTRVEPEIAQASSRVDQRWSREPFDLSVLNSVDGELTLKSEALQFGDYRLDNADIHATVLAGVMTADRVVGQLFGGPVSGTAVVRADGNPTLTTTLKLDAMDVGRAVQAVTGKGLATGKLGLDMNFIASGASAADLVSSLNGAGGMNITSLDVKQGGTGTALAPVIGLVAAMNQIALPVGGAGKTKDGLADLSLAFDIKDGVADAKNLALTSAFGTGTGKGTVDIAAWAIDFAGNMTVEPNVLTSLLSKGRIGKQEVPFSLKGALDKPGVKLGVAPAGGAATGGAPADPVQNLLQQVLPGVIPQKQPSQPTPQPQPQPQEGTLAPPPSQQPAPQQPLSPEDMLKKLMQGL